MRRFGLIAISIALSAVTLAGCNMAVPSRVNTSAIEVEDYTKTVLLPIAKVDKMRVEVVAGDYRRNGKSAPALVVPYMKGKRSTLTLNSARRSAAAYQEAFAQHGLLIRDVKYTETQDRDATQSAVLAYTATEAHAPANCTRMPGAKGAESQETTDGYTFGCEHATLISKMIARPDDLLGVDGAADSYSRREGPMMEGYMSGRTNPSLQGVTNSSGVISGGNVSSGVTTQ